MTSLDLSERSLNLYTSKKRIIRRVIFQGRQYGEQAEPPTPSVPSVTSSSSFSDHAFTLSVPSTAVPGQPTTTISQPLSSTSDESFSTLSLLTSLSTSTPFQWQATVTVTVVSLSPTVTTYYLGTVKRSRPTSTTTATVQSAQDPGGNKQLFPMGTIGAVIMSVLFAVMMGFVIFVARKRFGFPRSSPLSKLRKDAMAARMTNAIFEPKSFGGRPRRTRSLLSLVTLSSFRRGRSGPGSQISSLPPVSPTSAPPMSQASPIQSTSNPIASSSRRTLSDASESGVDSSSTFRAFLASGNTSRNIQPESSLGAQHPPLDSCTAIPDDLDTPIFLTASPRNSGFKPRK
ncbi:hypothetical protein CVT24_009369 [Panaeolus cyanescens]|uniref:Uncharacterized protein n=1 Tax=Panaeolus cyanescens TaxID=181874 RepID=A0A409Y854_9AGAR|nr:hypothetical protein CVT24_009369 [Panaeolus cyanescens]